MTAPSPLSEVLNNAERLGRLNLRTDDIHALLPQLSAVALRQALYRQQQRGRVVRLSRGADHWLIIPLQYSLVGAPPLETWLDRYLSKTLGIPYYVALLSAAETYGASPYGVMVTQVMVAERRRPITVGRHKVVFYVCSHVDKMPARWHETPSGRLKVSTPELTALDLIERASKVGGLARVLEVLQTLFASCTESGLIEALEARQESPSAQRLGALLDREGQSSLAACVAVWLRDKPHRPVLLEPGKGSSSVFDDNPVFKVQAATNILSANT